MSSRILHVLLVEDNPGDALLVRVLLDEQPGYSFAVRHVETIEAARNLIEHEIFDVVLLDLSLPDSRGIDSLKSVQSLARNLPIGILSGNDDAALAAEVFTQGAQDYLSKANLDGYWLGHCLHSVIRRYQMQRGLRDMAFIDELTRLFNRRGFLQLAEIGIKRRNRTHQDLAVVFLDMDGLKQINDAQGHLAGDHALQDFSRLLRKPGLPVPEALTMPIKGFPGWNEGGYVWI